MVLLTDIFIRKYGAKQKIYLYDDWISIIIIYLQSKYQCSGTDEVYFIFSLFCFLLIMAFRSRV